MKVEITKDNNCFYLTQDIADLNLYQRTKAIRNFINNETLILEQLVDSEIRTIFSRFNIKIPSTDQMCLKMAFMSLNAMGYDIRTTDLYDKKRFDKCIVIGNSSKNDICVMLEDDHILQAGIEVELYELR